MRQYAIIKTERQNELNWSLVNEQIETVRYNNNQDKFIVSFNAADSESILAIAEGSWLSLTKLHELINTQEWIQTEDI